LMRSPITQKGWSKPMTISRVADAMMVRDMEAPRSGLRRLISEKSESTFRRQRHRRI
jgi:hypothetical protein